MADPQTRLASGRARRTVAPLASHADLPADAGRAHPVDVLQAQAVQRLPDLAPVRYGRMLAAPFGFYRGAAAVMAADLSGTPTSGLITQVCGDAHLLNFGLFATPERRMVFDVNDFDETHPGPWEWDVKRLAASVAVAGRDNGLDTAARAAAVLATVGGYRTAMRDFAGMRDLDVWYARADLDDLAARLTKVDRRHLDRFAAKARSRDSLRASAKLTSIVDGQRRIRADPPLLVPVADLMPEVDRADLETRLGAMLRRYRRSLQSDRRQLLDRFTFVDLARKVVGVGSVGTRCWIMLLVGRDTDDPLLLQIKEAQRSVLAPYVRVAGIRHEGRRVVAGQRLMQAASDIFLGWDRIDGMDGASRDFYVRQLRDGKGAVNVAGLDPAGLRRYGALCGWTLARAHARSGDRIAIAGYLGDQPVFDHAVAEFAERYADRTEQDLAALGEAVRTGRVTARTGI